MDKLAPARRGPRAAAGWLERHPVKSALLLSLALHLALECLCRRSPVGGIAFLAAAPLHFLYGTGIILLTVSLAGLTRRRLFASLLISILWLGLGMVECVLKGFRVTPLTAIDFRLIFSVFSILHIYLRPWQIALVAAAVLAALALLTLAFCRCPKTPPVDYLRAGAGCAAAALFVWGSTALFSHVGLLPERLENLPRAYDQYGFVYCFATSLFDRGIPEPEDYSPEEVDVVVEELEPAPELPPPEEAPPVEPNIVVVQLESFFDVNYLKGIVYSENPVPVFTALKAQWPSGFLRVPALGAGTANSEFEVISGMSLDYFGTGEYPYETILQSNVCESYGYVLKEQGYACHAIHNNTATFYDRNKVYANLGFDTFTSAEYMEQVRRNPLGWAEDAVLTGEVQKALDATPGKDFVYAISVQPHGKYPEEVIDPDQVITASGMDPAVFPKAGFEYYLNQLHETDAFVSALVRLLAARAEPTVLVLFGDHLPNFDIPQEALSAGDLLQTEYVIWNNFGLAGEDRDLEAFQLLAEVLDRVGCHDGVLNRLHQEREGNPGYRQDLEMLEYDILYGGHYAYDGVLPFAPTALQMGVTPIAVGWAEDLGGALYVTGSHFTDASRVEIDGEMYDDTVRINSSTLLLAGVEAEESARVSVVQVTPEGEQLSASNHVSVYRGRIRAAADEESGESDKNRPS